MYNPCFECHNRYGKQYTTECDSKCDYAKMAKEKKLLEACLDELSGPIEDLHSAAIVLCMATNFSSHGCENCPVVIYDYDKRTMYEKTCLHEPCQMNLYKWIVDKAKEVCEYEC